MLAGIVATQLWWAYNNMVRSLISNGGFFWACWSERIQYQAKLLIKQAFPKSEKLYFSCYKVRYQCSSASFQFNPSSGNLGELGLVKCTWQRKFTVLLCVLNTLPCQTFNQGCQQITKWAYLGLQVFILTHSCSPIPSWRN